jgi:hypothetical protein
VQDGFPKLESFLHAAGRFPGAGKSPQPLGNDSRSWKVSPVAGERFQGLESLPSCWGTIPEAGKLPQLLGSVSSLSHFSKE